ncbi:MAG: isoamylase early set domain-containing protein [Spirochaetales bacterium]|nr:isoamylase early set domain-containing protein [Spirochaetales bacterium]
MKEVMKCSKVKELIKAWEETGSLSGEDYASIALHIKKCRDCAQKYAYLLPFISRDSTGSFTESQNKKGSSLSSPDIADSVMKNLPEKLYPVRKKRRLLPLMSAAAAVLIFTLAGIFLFPQFESGKDEVIVKFELTAPEAKSVSLAGDFNNWEPSKLFLKDRNGDGKWELKIRLKKGKVYTYNFLIDGTKWIPDPSSPTKVKDDFGGESSILKI